LFISTTSRHGVSRWVDRRNRTGLT
jgi:hypothetical protein